MNKGICSFNEIIISCKCLFNHIHMLYPIPCEYANKYYYIFYIFLTIVTIQPVLLWILLFSKTVLYNKIMLGSKGFLPPMIPDCFALRALTILKTFIIRSFFYEKWLLIHVFGGSQGQKSSCKQACIGFLTFWPWYHKILFYTGEIYANTYHTRRRSVWTFFCQPGQPKPIPAPCIWR